MKFKLGCLVATRGVADLIDSSPSFAEFVSASLKRYSDCDWGEMTEDDIAMNNHAVKSGDERIHAAYEYPEGKIWIITEWDRSVTTVLFPSEY